MFLSTVKKWLTRWKYGIIFNGLYSWGDVRAKLNKDEFLQGMFLPAHFAYERQFAGDAALGVPLTTKGNVAKRDSNGAGEGWNAWKRPQGRHPAACKCGNRD